MKRKNLDLFIILGVVTILAIATAVLLATKPFSAKRFDQLDSVSLNDYKEQSEKGSSYFVLLYDSNNDNYKIMIDTLLAYNEYVRNNDEALKLYIMDYSKNKKATSSLHFNISESELNSHIPFLATITSVGNLTETETGASNICNYLEDIMQGRR